MELSDIIGIAERDVAYSPLAGIAEPAQRVAVEDGTGRQSVDMGVYWHVVLVDAHLLVTVAEIGGVLKRAALAALTLQNLGLH